LSVNVIIGFGTSDIYNFRTRVRKPNETVTEMAWVIKNRQSKGLYKLQVEEDEMGWPCNTNGGEENTYRLLVGKPEGKGPLEDQDIGGWIILGWIL
jgi:hypothetical protein